MLRKRLIYIIAPGIIYFLLDIPIRMTGFANFGNLSGLKSFLPIVFGILFGPVSVSGMCLGAEAAARCGKSCPRKRGRASRYSHHGLRLLVFMVS